MVLNNPLLVVSADAAEDASSRVSVNPRYTVTCLPASTPDIPRQRGLQSEPCDLRRDRPSPCGYLGAGNRHARALWLGTCTSSESSGRLRSLMLLLLAFLPALVLTRDLSTWSLSRSRSAQTLDNKGSPADEVVISTPLLTSTAAAVSLWPWRHCCKSSVTLPCSRQRACRVAPSSPTQCLSSPGR